MTYHDEYIVESFSSQGVVETFITHSVLRKQDAHLVIFTAFPGVVTGDLQVSVLHVILSQEFVRHTLVLYITSLVISEMRRLYNNMIIILYFKSWSK